MHMEACMFMPSFFHTPVRIPFIFIFLYLAGIVKICRNSCSINSLSPTFMRTVSPLIGGLPQSKEVQGGKKEAESESEGYQTQNSKSS